MKEPNSKAEVANWCIVNALRLPNELIVSITAKLMQHLTDEERDQVLRLSSVVGQSEQFTPKQLYILAHKYNMADFIKILKEAPTWKG